MFKCIDQRPLQRGQAHAVKVMWVPDEGGVRQVKKEFELMEMVGRDTRVNVVHAEDLVVDIAGDGMGMHHHHTPPPPPPLFRLA